MRRPELPDFFADATRYDPAMSTLYFEADPAATVEAEFTGPTDVLVYFLSLAFSTRYGAQHDLARLALVLRGKYKIDLEPLTTFADRDIEVEADARELERVWQDAAPLAATLEQVNAALAAGEEEIRPDSWRRHRGCGSGCSTCSG